MNIEKAYGISKDASFSRGINACRQSFTEEKWTGTKPARTVESKIPQQADGVSILQRSKAECGPLRHCAPAAFAKVSQMRASRDKVFMD